MIGGAGGECAGPLRSPVLIGRQGELGRLVEVSGEPPAVAVVQGEAGVGKTRLVGELAEGLRLSERRVLFGHCHRLREPFPLGPLIEALRGVRGGRLVDPVSAVVGTLRPLLPELAAQLPVAPKPLGDPRAERHRVFRGLRELLGSLGPAVCVLEDLHWADEGTLEFLAFLVAEQPPELSLVLTYRGEESGAAPSVASLACRVPSGTSRAVIELSALSVAEVQCFVSAILETEEVSDQFAASVWERTAGLPFAVEELAALIREQHGRPVMGEGALERLGVPLAVRQLIIERVRPLEPDARRITYAAAVLGRPFAEDLVREVAGLSAVRAVRGLGQALSSALIQERKPGVYGFRHALAAQAVYEHIGGPERRQLHLRASAALQRAPEPRPLDQLAYHFQQALRQRQWLRYAEATADAALLAGEDRDAARILAHVLGDPDLPRASRVRLAIKLGSAALLGRVPRDAIPILRRTLEGRVPAGLRGELRLSLARLMLLAGDDSGSRGELDRAARELHRRPPLAALALSIAAEAGFLSGDAQDQLACVRRALEVSSRQADESVKLRVEAVNAYVLLELGDPAAWRAVGRLPWNAHGAERRLELVRACKYLAQAALGLGHFARADTLLDRADRIRAGLGHERFGVGLATIRGWVDWSTGRWHGLEEESERLVEASTQAPRMAGGNQLILARLRLARGEIEDAETRFGSLLELVHEAQVPAVMSGLVRLHIARGNIDEARKLAIMSLDQIRIKRLWAWSATEISLAVEVLASGGAKAQVRDTTRELAHALGTRDAPAARAALAFCWGAVADANRRHDVAARWFERAERAWRRLPFPYQSALVRERRGICLLQADDERGRTCLIEAVQEFDDLGASWDAARVKAALRARGLSVPYLWRGGRRGYGGELSPRETEVVALARRGRTNREIGDALFISSRTVEEHVASALAKLNLASKRELIAHGDPKDP